MRKLFRRLMRWLFRQNPFTGPVPDEADTQPLPPAEWPPVRKHIDWRGEDE